MARSLPYSRWLHLPPFFSKRSSCSINWIKLMQPKLTINMHLTDSCGPLYHSQHLRHMIVAYEHSPMPCGFKFFFPSREITFEATCDYHSWFLGIEAIDEISFISSSIIGGVLLFSCSLLYLCHNGLCSSRVPYAIFATFNAVRNVSMLPHEFPTTSQVLVDGQSRLAGVEYHIGWVELVMSLSYMLVV